MIKHFDICRLKSRERQRRQVLVVVLQHDVLSDLDTVIVAPLDRGMAEEARERLHPRVELADGTAVVLVERMAAIRRNEIGEVIGSAASCADAIKRAIDLALFGV